MVVVVVVSVVEDTLASVEGMVRAQEKLGFRPLHKPKSFYFQDRGQGEQIIHAAEFSVCLPNTTILDS